MPIDVRTCKHLRKHLGDAHEDTRIGKDVVTIVKTLSKVSKEGYLERFEASVDCVRM